MKKINRLLALAAAMTLLGSLFACSSIVSVSPNQTTFYATFYPIYALTAMIAEDIPDVEVKCLVQSQDICLRSYELSDWDSYVLNYGADCVIAGGNGLESFEMLLQHAADERNIPLVTALTGTKLTSFDVDAPSDNESHFSGANPHLYMSAEKATSILKNICDALVLIDSTNMEAYIQNYHSSRDKLTEVCAKIKEQTTVCTNKDVIIMNEALLYTALEAGLDVAAQIERESGEGLYGDDLDACLKTIWDSGAKVVLIEKQAPKSLVSALETNDLTVVRLDILNAHTQYDGYFAYLDALLSNAQTIANACEQAYSSR